MSHSIRTIEWKHIKSFANEANLNKFIAEHGAKIGSDYNDRLYVVRTPEGRWTAIVQLDTSKGGYIARWPFLSM
jgi:V8-like Glu-specific endopeptidase